MNSLAGFLPPCPTRDGFRPKFLSWVMSAFSGSRKFSSKMLILYPVGSKNISSGWVKRSPGQSWVAPFLLRVISVL